MKKIAVLLAFLLISRFAFGVTIDGWDKAIWGMSSGALMSTYKTEKISDSLGSPEFNRIIDGKNFNVRFKLDNNKLTAVRLSLYDATMDDYASTKEKLIKKYGTPSAKTADYTLWSVGKTSVKITVPLADSPISVMFVVYEQVTSEF